MDIKKIKDKLKKIFDGGNEETVSLSKRKHEKYLSIMDILIEKKGKVEKELAKESKKNIQSDRYQDLSKESRALRKLIDKAEKRAKSKVDIINNEEIDDL